MKYFRIALIILVVVLLGYNTYNQHFADKTVDMDTVTRDQLQQLAEKTGATKVRAFTARTGGGTGALDAIDGNDLYDLDIGIVITSTGAHFYVLDDDSSESEDAAGIYVIAPATNPGTKKWILQPLYANTVITKPQNDSELDFKPDTATPTDTRYRLGPNHSGGTSNTDDDNFEVRRSGTPGTNVDFRIRRDTTAYATDKVMQGYTEIQIIVVEWATDVTVGNGAFYFHVGQSLDGMNLTYCHAEVITAGTTGTTDIQLYNVTDSVDMLSTKITIDGTGTETGSDTATPYVVNTSNDYVSENDVIRVDIDQVSTVVIPEGLIVTLGFTLPNSGL